MPVFSRDLVPKNLRKIRKKSENFLKAPKNKKKQNSSQENNLFTVTFKDQFGFPLQICVFAEKYPNKLYEGGNFLKLFKNKNCKIIIENPYDLKS